MVEVNEFKAFFGTELFPLVIGKVGDFGNRTEIFQRVAVTLKAPAHRQRLLALNDFHLVDSSMTGNTSNSTIHMG